MKEAIGGKDDYNSYESENKFFLRLGIAGFSLMALLIMVFFGFIWKVDITGNAVTFVERETAPLASNIILIFMMILVVIYVIYRIQRK